MSGPSPEQAKQSVPDYAYFGPPLIEKYSPYWPKGVPWNPRDAFVEIGHLLDEEQVRQAGSRAPYGAIPKTLECTCRGKYCLLPVFDQFCKSKGIGRNTLAATAVDVRRPYMYYVLLPVVLRNPCARRRLEEECAPKRLRHAIETWGSLPPYYAGVVWKVRDLDALATAVTVPGTTHFRELVRAVNEQSEFVHPGDDAVRILRREAAQ